MSWLRFLHRKRSDAHLQDEIEAYLAEETADNEARGMSPNQARREARLKFGNDQKVRGISVGAELSAAVDPHRSRSEIRFSHLEAHARILDHGNYGHGSVYWRRDISFHDCAVGTA